MQIGKVHLPCGCEARKEIMFTSGQWDRNLTALTAVMVTLGIITFIYGRRSQ